MNKFNKKYIFSFIALIFLVFLYVIYSALQDPRGIINAAIINLENDIVEYDKFSTSSIKIDADFELAKEHSDLIPREYLSFISILYFFVEDVNLEGDVFSAEFSVEGYDNIVAKGSDEQKKSKANINFKANLLRDEIDLDIYSEISEEGYVENFFRLNDFPTFISPEVRGEIDKLIGNWIHEDVNASEDRVQHSKDDSGSYLISIANSFKLLLDYDIVKVDSSSTDRLHIVDYYVDTAKLIEVLEDENSRSLFLNRLVNIISPQSDEDGVNRLVAFLEKAIEEFLNDKNKDILTKNNELIKGYIHIEKGTYVIEKISLSYSYSDKIIFNFNLLSEIIEDRIEINKPDTYKPFSEVFAVNGLFFVDNDSLLFNLE